MLWLGVSGLAFRAQGFGLRGFRLVSDPPNP